MKGNGLQSMTGFGRGSATSGSVQVEVEIKSVNHRFLDLNCKLPRAYLEFESDIKGLISGRIGRGHLDVFVQRQMLARADGNLKLDHELARQLLSAYLVVARDEECFAPQDSKSRAEFKSRALLEILRRPEVLSYEDRIVDEAAERGCLLQACSSALEGVLAAREREGRELGKDLSARVLSLTEMRCKIEKLAVGQPESLRQKLLERVQRLTPEVNLDPLRLAQEVAFLADRVDVAEELVRFDTHLKRFCELLESARSGRQLDFLTQELLRETNTIGSKAQDGVIQGMVVEAKQILEKVREQVQNVE